MAADLTGMFAQLNKAIQGNPMAGEQGKELVAQFSKGVGNAASGATSLVPGAKEGADPYSFMTKPAKVMQSEQDLGKLDLQTPEGMSQAAQIYQKIGDPNKAVTFATAARELRDKQTAELEKGAQEINAEAQRKRGASIALSRGDKEGARAIQGGLISPQDYYMKQLETGLKVQETIMGRDPYAGAFTQEVTINGTQVPVRFDKSGKAINILGEGHKDYDLKEIFNPATGGTQMAAIDKNNPQNVQFVGTGEVPDPAYDIKEVDGKFHVWMTPPDGSTPQRMAVVDSLTEAEKQMFLAKDSVQTANLVQSIDKAIALVESDANVGGWFGPLEYLPATDARSLNTLLTSIKANVGFEQLTDMKAEGGTLGQVSNIENLLLQSYVTQLDSWTDKKDLATSLQKVKNLRIRMNRAATMDNPDELFTAVVGANGEPTGERMYVVDEDTIAVIQPNGAITIETRDGTQQ